MEKLTTATRMVLYLKPKFGRRMKLQECIIVLPLDAQLRPLRRPIITAIGTVDSVQVILRDVFRDAIKANASSVVVAHNHPSGDVEPSPDDIAVTARLRKAGTLLGIQVIDHLIMSSDKDVYYSFAEQGQL